MRGLGRQLTTSLKLYARNRMGLIYGYLFPVVFLVAFHVLYQYDRVPLVRHVGELLTVTILGGACFGLATALVSERERGVWRRFKLVPIPMGTIVVSTVLARYLLLLSAGLLQLTLARAFGMPWPAHPVDLFLTFTLASFSFLGVGLVIAMLADNVPAVQALGQSIFLPMLILGGVAVPITALPEWARPVSAFFPGRYAVEAIQATANGDGITSAIAFPLVALAFIGLAACLAAGGMFRWDAQQRFMASHGRGWLALALLSWLAVGGYAWRSGYAQLLKDPEPRPQATAATPAAETPPVTPAAAPSSTSPASSGVSTPLPATASNPASQEAITAPGPPAAVRTGPASTAVAPPPTQAAPTIPPPMAAASSPEGDWRGVRLDQIDEDLVFTRLPPDSGVVTPIAAESEEFDADTAVELGNFQVALQEWAPGKVADPVQRVRNLLLVAGVVDVFQMATESYVPLYVFEQIHQAVPDRDELLRILYWIAVHPDDGSDGAVDQMRPLGIPTGPGQMDDVRARVGIYAVKLIGRITGKRPGR